MDINWHIIVLLGGVETEVISVSSEGFIIFPAMGVLAPGAKNVFKIPKFKSSFVCFTFTYYIVGGVFSKIHIHYYNWGDDVWYMSKNIYGQSIPLYYKSDNDYLYIGIQMSSDWTVVTLDCIRVSNYSGYINAKIENYKTLGGVSRFSSSDWTGYNTL